MTYATVQDLIDRYGEREMIQLTDIDEPRTDAVVSARAQRALDDAAAEVDGYLAGLYALPLSPVPGTLRRVAIDIARYHLGSVPTDSSEAKRYYSVSGKANSSRDGQHLRCVREAAAGGTTRPQRLWALRPWGEGP